MIAARIAIPLLGGAMLAAIGIVSLCRGEEPVWLAFDACAGAVCQHVELSVPGGACAARGQLAIIEWLREHEWLELRGGWTCAAGERA